MPDSLLVGSLLGDYEILGELGRGGMGVVYRARQRSLDREVAVKTLPTEMAAEPAFVDRFLREARAAANCVHNNVIQVFDAGVSDNVYFFVMELIDGQDLEDQIDKKGRLNEREAWNVLHQAAKGLAFAHELKIIHRDVKPANLVKTKTGIVKVGDLGLAKWKPDAGKTSLTAPHSLMGSPYYISPEQIRGEKDIDGRTDIYSLGMTFYHLLAGSPPFQKGTAPEIMAQHLAEEPIPLNKINPFVSQAASDLFQKMTSKNRERRIQTMAEIRDFTGKMLEQDKNAPIVIHTSESALNKKTRKITWGILSMNTVLVVILGLVAFWTYPRLRQPAKKDIKIEKTAPEQKPVAIPAESSSAKHEETSVSHATSAEPATEVVTSPKTALLKNESKEENPSPEETAETMETPIPIVEVSKPASIEASTTVEKVKVGPMTFSGPETISIAYIANVANVANKDNAISRNYDRIGFGTFPNGESKILIHPDFLHEKGQAEKILKCQSAILELSIRSTEAKTPIKIELFKILTPWGNHLPNPPSVDDVKVERKQMKVDTIPSWPSYLNKLNGEVNWFLASGSAKTSWHKAGASSAGKDYDPNPIRTDQGLAFYSMNPGEKNFVVHFDILSDLQNWSREAIQKKNRLPHYGWILQATGEKGAYLHSNLATSKHVPRIILSEESAKKAP